MQAAGAVDQPPGDLRHQMHVAIRPDRGKECVLVNFTVDRERDPFVQMRGEHRIALTEPREQITHGRGVNRHPGVSTCELTKVAGEIYPRHCRTQSAASGMRASSSAFNTFGGDIGRSVNRIPNALSTALAMAAIGGTIGVSPTPRTP